MMTGSAKPIDASVGGEPNKMVDPRAVEARATIAARRAAKRCPHRTDPQCGCANVPAACSHPERPPLATIDECLACPHVPSP